jgi:hypothetical protein
LASDTIVATTACIGREPEESAGILLDQTRNLKLPKSHDEA